MPRLFAAIPMPADVALTLDRVRQPTPGAWWIPPADMHLTLRFAGDIGMDKAREFASELARIELLAFSLKLQGLGSFGGDEPRVLWAGVAPCEALEALARACDRSARNAGLPPDGRTWKPHVTLARLRHTPVDAVVRILERKATFNTPEFFVPKFALMSSKPGAGGGPYVIEEEFIMGGGQYADYADENNY
jgi:RNA 2',3'-cyclic 3'-phosphodiesterase